MTKVMMTSAVALAMMLGACGQSASEKTTDYSSETTVNEKTETLSAAEELEAEGEYLIEEAEDQADYLKDKADDMMESAEDTADAYDQNAEDLMDDAKDKADALEDAAEDIKDPE